jgi:hypothetical protein
MGAAWQLSGLDHGGRTLLQMSAISDDLYSASGPGEQLAEAHARPGLHDRPAVVPDGEPFLAPRTGGADYYVAQDALGSVVALATARSSLVSRSAQEESPEYEITVQPASTIDWTAHDRGPVEG